MVFNLWRRFTAVRKNNLTRSSNAAKRHPLTDKNLMHLERAAIDAGYHKDAVDMFIKTLRAAGDAREQRGGGKCQKEKST
jgi:hypothetical protein